MFLPEGQATRVLDAVIISDLHLGSDNCQAKSLGTFLERIADGQLQTQRLILNGDVFDSIDFRRLKKNHWKVLSLIRKLSDHIEIIWLCGNHDGSAEIISHLLGVTVKDEYVLHTGDRQVLILHGHVFDEFIDSHPILTWMADVVYYLLQQIDRTHYFAKLAKKGSKTFLRCAGHRGEVAGARPQERLCGGLLRPHPPREGEPGAEGPLLQQRLLDGISRHLPDRGRRADRIARFSRRGNAGLASGPAGAAGVLTLAGPRGPYAVFHAVFTKPTRGIATIWLKSLRKQIPVPPHLQATSAPLPSVGSGLPREAWPLPTSIFPTTRIAPLRFPVRLRRARAESKPRKNGHAPWRARCP